MEFQVSYTLDNEQQFWDELEDILSTECDTHELIDNALRNYLSFTTTYKEEYLHSDDDITKCSAKLLESELFKAHKDYVRRQIIYCLLQEDSPDVLHQVSCFLCLDGRQNEETFEVMNEVGAFSRLIELVQIMKDSGAGLHRMLMQLLYEMSRIQRIRQQELMMIEEDFMIYLLRLIEGVSDDVNDPYHYPVIRVLLVLNEQYMVATHTLPAQSLKSPPPIPQTITGRINNTSTSSLPNRLISALSTYGSSFRTFGENIILLLNRESETSLQLLILKILYLLFTTRATYEYFYTNDLRVLVDVMLRNLLDLPFSARALRHTYLRVLHPLLANTQLALTENHYKRDEILKVLSMLVGSSGVGAMHFGQIDETTKRLGVRCARVPWLDENGSTVNLSPLAAATVKLGVNEKAAESSLSVVGDSVAAVIAKPGEQTPSREKEGAEGNPTGTASATDAGGGGGAAAGDGGVKVTDGK